MLNKKTNKNILKMNKKAFVYTLISIAFIMLIFSISTMKSKESIKEKQFVIETRIRAINLFLQDVERDMGRGLYIASFRSLLGLSEYIALNGTYLTSINASFNELITNESLNGIHFNVTNNSGIISWGEKIKERANELSIDINFTRMTIWIYQTEPWSVDVFMDINYTIRDKSGTSLWNRNKQVYINIQITDFEDPLYTVGSNGTIINTIRPSPFISFVNASDNSTANLTDHMINSFYVHTNISPSFLQRFEGHNTSSPCCGIESLVDMADIYNSNLIHNKTVVDFIYWNKFDNPPSTRIDNMPSWFRLNQRQLSTYGAVNLTLDW